ncbi:MAG TPA: hypothetical protein PKK06_04820 [Phycisphaerae bacterium]|nr:hypothetical protein [Phycisphaerae bacterium]HNU45162.1 hypothetical protein [Phycisphaerae bacterium]
MNMLSIEERLTHLERELRCWRRATFLLVLAVIGLGVLGAVQPFDGRRTAVPGNNPEFDVVTARALRIMSPLGTSVVHLSVDAKGSGRIAMNNAYEKPTVLICSDDDDCGRVALVGKGKRGFIVDAGSDGLGNGRVVVTDALGEKPARLAAVASLPPLAPPKQDGPDEPTPLGAANAEPGSD